LATEEAARGWGRPRRLARADDVEAFTCGHADLDDWFHRFALADQSAGMSTVFVSERDGRIAGFYALATGGVEPAQAPSRVTTGVGRHAVPVIVLTRMAVSSTDQGRGLGTALLRDACLRVARLSDEVGVRALLVHAKDDEARRFYEGFAEFEPSPTDPLHLVLLIKDLRRAVRRTE
jgi:GNAT superfamily N-acetyltransferase